MASAMPRAEPISTASEVELKILERTVRGDTARRVPFFVPGGDMERSVRCLLAWMNEGEAINALLGRLPIVAFDETLQDFQRRHSHIIPDVISKLEPYIICIG